MSKRSSLRKYILPTTDGDNIPAKRRISFSGKKFVREFCQEEVTQTYEDSYEISDRINSDETAQKLDNAKSSLSLTVKSQDINEENKENVCIKSKTCEVTCKSEKSPQANIFSNLEEDLACSSFQSSIANIENIGVTLFDNEMRSRSYFDKTNNRDSEGIYTNTLSSLSLDENDRKLLRLSNAKDLSEQFINDLAMSYQKNKEDKFKSIDDINEQTASIHSLQAPVNNMQIEKYENKSIKLPEIQSTESIIKYNKKESPRDCKMIINNTQELETNTQLAECNIPRASKVTIRKVCIPMTKKNISQISVKKNIHEKVKLTPFKTVDRNSFLSRSKFATPVKTQIPISKSTEKPFDNVDNNSVDNNSVDNNVSPLCPPTESKVCSLLQLHDQIVSGKIQVYSSDVKKPANTGTKPKLSTSTKRIQNEKEPRTQPKQHIQSDQACMAYDTISKEKVEKKHKKNKYRYLDEDDVRSSNTKMLNIFQNAKPIFSQVLPEAKTNFYINNEIEIHKEKSQIEIVEPREPLLGQDEEHNNKQEKMKKISRKTLFFNQDLDETKIEEITNNKTASKKRQTTHNYKNITDLVVEEEAINSSFTVDAKKSLNNVKMHKTISIPEDIEKDIENNNKIIDDGIDQKSYVYEKTMEQAELKVCRRDQTQIFQDDLEEDLEIKKETFPYELSTENLKSIKNSRQTQYFYEDIKEDPLGIRDEHQRETIGDKTDVEVKISEWEDIKQDIQLDKEIEIEIEIENSLDIYEPKELINNGSTILETYTNNVEFNRKNEETFQCKKSSNKKEFKLRKTRLLEESIEEDDQMTEKVHSDNNENFNIKEESQYISQNIKDFTNTKSISNLNLQQTLVSGIENERKEKSIIEEKKAKILLDLQTKQLISEEAATNLSTRNRFCEQQSKNITLYYNDDIEEEEEEKEEEIPITKENKQKSKEIIKYNNKVKDNVHHHFNQEEDHINFNQNLQAVQDNIEIKNEIIILDQKVNNLEQTKNNTQNTQLSKNVKEISYLKPMKSGRKTVYDEEQMELETDMRIQSLYTLRHSLNYNAHLEEPEENDYNEEEHRMELDADIIDIKKYNNTDDDMKELQDVNQVVVILNETEEIKDISMRDQTITAEEEEEKDENSISKSAATSIENIIINNSLIATPSRNSVNQRRLCKMYEITPRRSLLEFEAREREIKFGSFTTPLHSFLKRLHSNLTPNLPQSKKSSLSSHILKDYQIEEKYHKKDEENKKIPKPIEEDEEVEEKNKNEMLTSSIIDLDTEIFVKRDINEISGIIRYNETTTLLEEEQLNELKESTLNTTEKKECNLSSLMEITDQSIHINENFTDSVQIVRQTGCMLTSPSFQANILTKPLQFDDKPIIVPDDNTIEFDSNGATTGQSLSMIKKKNNFKGVIYSESSIDDYIDKTHINLIDTIEDDEENPIEIAKIDNDLNAQPCQTTHPPSLATNNDTILCRKCKRCRETFSDELLINESLDFSLLTPQSPLSFDRLRRLRKLPSLDDIERMLQIFNLDNNNMENISTEDSNETLSDTKGENETSKKYDINATKKNYNMMFKKLKDEKMKELRKPVSVIERLRQKVSTSLPRWIFDDQMQYRCKLLCTHRLLLKSAILITYEKLAPLHAKILIKTIELTERLPG
uniref:Uncharacterized protein n=1 Tax=Glossina brevipalpis TaxID=37001 RepID=A0A1A9WV77_9MUSC